MDNEYRVIGPQMHRMRGITENGMTGVARASSSSIQCAHIDILLYKLFINLSFMCYFIIKYMFEDHVDSTNISF